MTAIEARVGHDITFEPEFLRIVQTQGLAAALADLVARHRLDDIERMAVEATLRGFLAVTGA